MVGRVRLSRCFSDALKVQTLDGEAHRLRKALFMSPMTPEGVRRLAEAMARLWERPEEFRPERFRGRAASPFDLIPQGGGDHHRGHRCAGEWVTVELMKAALSQLAEFMTYDVPAQDLRVSLSRAPAIPRSRFVINVASA